MKVDHKSPEVIIPNPNSDSLPSENSKSQKSEILKSHTVNSFQSQKAELYSKKSQMQNKAVKVDDTFQEVAISFSEKRKNNLSSHNDSRLLTSHHNTSFFKTNNKNIHSSLHAFLKAKENSIASSGSINSLVLDKENLINNIQYAVLVGDRVEIKSELSLAEQKSHANNGNLIIITDDVVSGTSQAIERFKTANKDSNKYVFLELTKDEFNNLLDLVHNHQQENIIQQEDSKDSSNKTNKESISHHKISHLSPKFKKSNIEQEPEFKGKEFFKSHLNDLIIQALVVKEEMKRARQKQENAKADRIEEHEIEKHEKKLEIRSEENEKVDIRKNFQSQNKTVESSYIPPAS